MTKTTSTHAIPYSNVGALQAQIAKLNKKVAKLNKKGYQAALVEMSFGSPRNIKVAGPGGVERDVLFVDVTVQGDKIEASGWEFIATLQHEEGGTIVRPVPGTVAEGELAAYRNVQPGCEHCGFDRRRKDTFIVRNVATRAHKQVGRNCLADFFGFDPHLAAAYAEIMASAGSMAEYAENEGFGGGAGEYACTIEKYLPYVCCAIREDGWLSRTAAKEQDRANYATATVAWNAGVFPPPMSRQADLLHPTAEDAALAEKVLAGALDYFVDADDAKLSDYEHNLKVALDGGIVTFRLAGIIASVVPFMQRKWGQEAERKARAEAGKVSEFVGQVGQRLTFAHMTLIFQKSIETQFGVSTLYKFVDEKGNNFTWFSTKNVGIDVGATYSVKGTIKKHEEYQGVRQTMLNRCVVAK